jgi:hypothetical protein
VIESPHNTYMTAANINVGTTGWEMTRTTATRAATWIALSPATVDQQTLLGSERIARVQVGREDGAATSRR